MSRYRSRGRFHKRGGKRHGTKRKSYYTVSRGGIRL